MADQPPFSRATESPKSGDGGLAYLDQALWRQLAEAGSEAEFCHSWLVLQGRLIGGVHRSLVILGPPDKGPYAPVAVWPRGLQVAALIRKLSHRQKPSLLHSETFQSEDSLPFPSVTWRSPITTI